MSYPIDTSHRSPNHSGRGGADISMLVWHATVGSYASSLAWLTSPASEVSTHYLIRKDGYIAQLVPDALAAWHAGKSTWLGLNKDQIQAQSIGIELENDNDGRDPYPPQQIAAAHWLGQQLVNRYQITRPMVVRHLDIATPKGRKTDPAPPFPWPAFRDSLFLDTAIRYRAITCAPIFQDRRPDAPLAGSASAGTIEAIDDLTSGWLHLQSGLGFSPIGCWERAT